MPGIFAKHNFCKSLFCWRKQKLRVKHVLEKPAVFKFFIHTGSGGREGQQSIGGQSAATMGPIKPTDLLDVWP